MGLKSYPTAKFEEIDIKDEVQFHRVITRLLEIGILTPEQGIKSMQTGLYPNAKDLSKSQEGYVEDREKGYYNPLVGGIPMIESLQSEKDRELREEETENKELAPSNNETQNKTPPSAGRPNGTNQIPLNASKHFDRSKIQGVIYDIENLQSYAEGKFKDFKKIDSINENQKSLIIKLCESVICAKEKKQWKRSLSSCVKNINNIEKLSVMPEVLSIGAEHDLAEYPSAILYHSKNQ